MKTGNIQDFLQLHQEREDINKKQIHLTDEQVKAIEYLAKDQGESFEDIAMALIQYQLQILEIQHQQDIRNQAKLN